MFHKPLACPFHEKPVKPIIWDSRLDITDIGSRNAELEEAKREINQIAFSEKLHQRIAVGLICANLVVHRVDQVTANPKFGSRMDSERSPDVDRKLFQ